jgi:ABC-type glycerol-3-phosphate transport system permease component
MSRTRALHLGRDVLVVGITFGLLLALIFPTVWIFLTSIRPEREVFSDTFRLISSTITFESYRTLLATTTFATYIRNSLVVSLITTLVAVSISLLAAYSFSRRRFRFRGVLLITVVFSQLFPYVILITPIYVIFYHLKLVNTSLGLIIAYVATTVPFCVYMLLGYLDSVPRELDEAAIIDGCSTLSVIWSVVLPVAWPGVAATAIYSFAQAWNEYLIALTLVTRNELKTIPVGLASFFGEYTTRWDLVMTASVLATVPTLIIFLILQRQLVSGLAAGAVKQ